MSYCGYVTTIKELRKHENADRLQIATVFGNDVVVGLDTKVGDKVLYLPTDGKLDYDFAKSNNLLKEKDENGINTGGYMDAEKRHVTSIRLRGEKSDGLILPITSLSPYCDISTLEDGSTITTINGILLCEKYIPKGKSNKEQSSPKGKKKEPKESYPFFEQHIDTSQLAYNLGKFKEGDLCYITLKMHGTSQRTARTIKKKKNLIHNVLNKVGFKVKPRNEWSYITGTRRVTLNNFKGGYYSDNNFRKEWHDVFEGKLEKGIEVFYEVVGYTEGETLIMPECNNKKTKDKEFIKQYGAKTRFTYGCGTGQSDIYVYRMTMTNEDGHVVEIPWEQVKIYCEKMGVKHVPELEKFIFTTKEDLMDRISKHEDGTDPIGKTHIREGVIVRIENKEKFTALKQKNFNFKVLESIIKADDVLDLEEAESLDLSEVNTYA